MSQVLQGFIWLPLIGFFISLFVSRKKEKIISGISILVSGIYLCCILVFIFLWILKGSALLNCKHLVLFKANDIEIFIDFYFDKITAVFALTGAFIALAVSIFSRYYLHRDEGFKRFFSILLLFILSYNLVVFSGNFETFFIGWEILGICSFLLIAFYRDRYLPVRNSLKVISIYRLGDICLILAMWMSHHLWHQNITFLQLQDAQLVMEHQLEHNWYAFFIALMLVIAASAKSAQLPFSSWLPRAMEGPTSSSAIFYGSLSVHLGVFLLLRTYPYWENILAIKLLIIAIGFFTSLVATSIARVQSSVKTQIAYSSITQIGLMFIETALGLKELALFHFVGNSLLRTYQLLVSPSVLGYRIHEQFFNFSMLPILPQNPFLRKLKNSIYILSVKEWNLDYWLQQLLWKPFKWLGKKLNYLSYKSFTAVLFILFLIGVYSNLFQEQIHLQVFEFLPHLFSFLGLVLILKAFAESGDARAAWLQVVSGQLFITLSITLLNEDFGHNHILLYLGGSIASASLGYYCLQKLKAMESSILLNQFHGHVYEHPKIGFVFLVSCLGFVGLPFTPTFIGIDILFSHIHKHEELLIIFTALSFMIMEIAVLRIYARLFLGQHKKEYHPIAYRSS